MTITTPRSYHSVVGSIHDMTTPTGLFNSNENEDAKVFPAHWGLNLMVENTHVIDGGKSSVSNRRYKHLQVMVLSDQQLLNLPSETTQTILVKDKHNDKVDYDNIERTFVLSPRTDLATTLSLTPVV